MGIFLCLGDTRLFLSIGCKKGSKCIGNLFLDERHLFVLNGHVILCKAYITSLDSLPPVKSGKPIVTERPCNLPCTVWTEIKEDNGIIVLNCGHRRAVLHNDRREYELIRGILVVGSLNSLWSAYRRLAFPEYHSPVCLFHTVPTVITVHGIVTSHDGRNFAHANLVHLSHKLLHIFFSGCRRRITSI